MKIFANKLKKGDEVRVIAPALSLKFIAPDNINYAIKTLESLGLKPSFGKNINENDIWKSSSIVKAVALWYEVMYIKRKNVNEPI